MPRQYTVNADTLLPESVRMEDLEPYRSQPTIEDQTGISWDDAVETLPTVMGGALSLAGGGRSTPVGMMLAGVGGAGGEGYRQAINAIQGDWDQVPPDLRSQAEAIIQQFAVQGGTEGAGRALGPLLKLFGRGMYRTALKPGKAVRQEFPTVTKDAVEAGIPITRTGKGAAKAERLVDESASEVSDVLRTAEMAGAKPVTMRPVAKSLQRTGAKIDQQAIRQDDLDTLQTIRDSVIRENPGPISLTRAQTMKQAEQRKAVEGYRKIARGADVNSVPLDARMDVARGLRESIERRVPEVGPMNARTQKLIGVEQGVKNAEDRIANNNLIGMQEAITTGIGVAGGGVSGDAGTGLGVALMTEAITRPEIASRLGIALDRAGKPMVTPQLLRVLQAINALSAASSPR